MISCLTSRNTSQKRSFSSAISSSKSTKMIRYGHTALTSLFTRIWWTWASIIMLVYSGLPKSTVNKVRKNWKYLSSMMDRAVHHMTRIFYVGLTSEGIWFTFRDTLEDLPLWRMYSWLLFLIVADHHTHNLSIFMPLLLLH